MKLITSQLEDPLSKETHPNSKLGNLDEVEMNPLSLEKRVIQSGYDRKSCWVHARCGFLPLEKGKERAIITLQKSHMGGGEDTWDVFSGLWMMHSEDQGHTWSKPAEIPSLAEWHEADGSRVVVSDFTPQWHDKTQRLLGIGHTCRYRNGKLMDPPRPRETAYSIFDHERNIWGPVEILNMEEPERFFCAGAGSTQWAELPNGEILLPIYFKDRKTSSVSNPLTHASTKVLVLRCDFDGAKIRILEKGRELEISAYRGLGEPSLIVCGGMGWLTLRNGARAYVATSENGLDFSDPIPWLFDDGEELGSYDTQQHWLRLGDRLFLVYTRRGLDNDHVVRHRAPLLMAEVDQTRRCIRRETEQIVVEERSVQLGNFGVSHRTDNESWVCVSEWMETAGSWNKPIWSALERKFPDADLDALAQTPGRCGLCELSGGDNSIHLVKVSAQ